MAFADRNPASATMTSVGSESSNTSSADPPIMWYAGALAHQWSLHRPTRGDRARHTIIDRRVRDEVFEISDPTDVIGRTRERSATPSSPP